MYEVWEYWGHGCYVFGDFNSHESAAAFVKASAEISNETGESPDRVEIRNTESET